MCKSIEMLTIININPTFYFCFIGNETKARAGTPHGDCIWFAATIKANINNNISNNTQVHLRNINNEYRKMHYFGKTKMHEDATSFFRYILGRN